MDLVECYECKAIINSSETFWSVNVHLESLRDRMTKVSKATAVAVYCDDCARQRDLDHIYVPLKAERNSSQQRDLGV